MKQRLLYAVIFILLFGALGCTFVKESEEFSSQSLSSIIFDKVIFSSQNSYDNDSDSIHLYNSSLTIDFSTDPSLATARLSSGKNGPMQCSLDMALSTTESHQIRQALSQMSLCTPVQSGLGIGMPVLTTDPPGIEVISTSANRIYLDGYQGSEKVFRGLRLPLGSVITNIPYICGEIASLEAVLAIKLLSLPQAGCPSGLGQLFDN